MFSTLLESRSRRTRRTGGSIVSIGLHVAAIGAMVAATANATVRTQNDPGETRIIFEAPPPQVPRPVAVTPRGGSGSTNDVRATGTPALEVPLEICACIPPIDFAKGITNPDDFAGGRRGVPTGVPGGNGVSQQAGHYFEWEVEKLAMSLPGSRGPVFPEVLRHAGVAGQVLAEFVVDTTGFARMDTFRVLESDYELFTASVRRALEKMRFLPAEVGGRKVPQLVQQMFQFSLTR